MKHRAITLFFVFISCSLCGLFAQNSTAFTAQQIDSIKLSCDSISGPGKPVIGDGHGGWRSGSDGVLYSGAYPADPRWKPMALLFTSGSAIKDGLLPPIKPLLELHLRDTQLCSGGDGYYYMTGSSGDNIWAYAAGVELWRSKDLKNWEYLGVVWSIEKDGTWEKKWSNLHGKPARALWAPEIHYIKGNYYICFSMPPTGISILKSTTGKPEGPYVKSTTVTDKPFVNGIDPTLFQDDDGKVYFTYSGGNRIALMKDDMSDIAEPYHPVILENPDHDPTHHTARCERRGMNDFGTEGAVLFKANRKYYLGAADGYQGRYSSCVAIADNIFGPYRNRQETVPCGGGTGFFEDKQGNWWCSYFGNDNQSPWREKPGIVKIDFDADGKIIVSKHPFFVEDPIKKPPAAAYDIRSYGAVGDGKTVNANAIQAAIDKCNEVGGGTVLVCGGQFVTGTLYIKSNITLRIEAGAVLLGSSVIADYATNTDRTMYNEPYMNRCLIFARDAQNITIEGDGIIDGQGKSFPEKSDSQRNRPKMIRFISCSHIRVHDLTLKSPASWTSEWRYCTDIAVDGLTISSRNISNGDGLDFDGCTKVRVSNSTFDTGDDCVCLQTSDKLHPCVDVAIINCNFSGRWAGIRIGLLSRSNFENVVVSNCTFRDHNDSGLKIQMMEGAVMSNMLFTNLVMENVPRPVFITFNKQNAAYDAQGEPAPMNRVHDIVFNNIIVQNSIGGKNCGFIVTGMPGHPVENITFSNIHAVFPGGVPAGDSRAVLAEFTTENLKGRWPEVGGLRATVPAFGIYLRHVKGVTLQDITIGTINTDARAAIVFVDVTSDKTSDTPLPVIQ